MKNAHSLTRLPLVGQATLAPATFDVTTAPVTLQYRPTVLTPTEWENAKSTAIAAVGATTVTNVLAARSLLSTLANFLAWDVAWDRTAAPDLEQLLTLIRIDEYVTEKRIHKMHRSVLRRLARTVGVVPPYAPVNPRPSLSRLKALRTRVDDVGPFSAIVAAYESTGYTLGGSLSKVLCQVADETVWDFGRLVTRSPLAVNAGDGASDILNHIGRAAQELRAASDVVLAEVVVVPSVKPQPVKSKTKAKSRTAAVREAKAAQAVRDAAVEQWATGVIVEGQVAELPELSPDIASAIAAFRPNGFAIGDWARVEAATRVLATAYQPPSLQWVRNQTGGLARFSLWVAQRPARPTPNDLLRPGELLGAGLVEEYLAGPMATRPMHTRATVRSVIRRALRNLAPDLAPKKLAYCPVQAPYTPAECAALVRLARNQPTSAMRRGLSAIIALGLGAGLSAGEQRDVTPERIREVPIVDGLVGLVVEVTGERARTAVVRADYEELLREAISRHFDEGRTSSQPLYGRSITRQNVTGNTKKSARTALGPGVEVDAARLRTTWLVACMNAPVPLGALLRASGLRSARTLVDLVGYCIKPDAASIAIALRAIKDDSDVGA